MPKSAAPPGLGRRILSRRGTWLRAFAASTAAIFAASKKLIPPSIGGSFSSGRRCVASENVVAVFCRRVAGEALCVQRLIARFALREVGESPAARRQVFFRVLDHELSVHGRTGKG